MVKAYVQNGYSDIVTFISRTQSPLTIPALSETSVHTGLDPVPSPRKKLPVPGVQPPPLVESIAVTWQVFSTPVNVAP